MKGRTKRLLEKALAEAFREKPSRARRAVEEKKALAEDVKKILSEYRSFVVISATGLPAPQFLEIKKKLEARGLSVRMIKGKVFAKAAESIGMPGVEKIAPLISAPSIFVFSKDHNVFELGEIVRSTKAYRKAKPGDRADAEIVIPAGPTGIPPGPMISVFGRLKIPVQPRGSEIHVIRDTVVAKPGQEISPELASLLNKLGITPFVVAPKIVVGYEGGLVIPGESLVLDVEGTRKMISEAAALGAAVAAELVIPEPSIVELALRRAYTRASALASELGIVTPANAPAIIAKAIARALALAQEIQKHADLGIKVEAQPPQQAQQEAKKEETRAEEKQEEEKKGVSEEELEQGLSALFG